MTNEASEKSRETAERVVEFAEELEAGSDARFAQSDLADARAVLHRWIDDMTAVVIAPALGRVTLIHDGRESTISSATLPFLMSKPL